MIKDQRFEKDRAGSHNFRLANWGQRQRSGSLGADHLLIRFTALCNKSHRCILSDAGIAKCFGLKKRSVSRHLTTLRNNGLIASHYEGPGRSKRVITFLLPSDDSHIGASPAPKWRTGQRQNGGQNLTKNESLSGRAFPEEQRPVPVIAPNASPWEAALAYRPLREQGDDGGGGA